MTTLQQPHEQRPERPADLAQQPGPVPYRVEVWRAIYEAARAIGCTHEEAEQYADRWWIDGGF